MKGWATIYGIVKGERIMYVGVTTQDIRQRMSSHVSKCLAPYDPKHRISRKFHSWLKKNHMGVTVRILEICPRDIRFDREKYFMDLHKTVERGLNLPQFMEAPGREKGCWNPSGKTHYAYGDSEATRKAVIASIKARKGKPLSEETKNKMRIARSKNKLNARPVRCVETGVVFSSVRDAARRLGFSGAAAIGRALREGTVSGGFHWEYVGLN